VVHADLNNLPKDARSRLGTLAHGGPSDPDTLSRIAVMEPGMFGVMEPVSGC
jgi:hypothetical protein